MKRETYTLLVVVALWVTGCGGGNESYLPKPRPAEPEEEVAPAPPVPQPKPAADPKPKPEPAPTDQPAAPTEQNVPQAKKPGSGDPTTAHGAIVVSDDGREVVFAEPNGVVGLFDVAQGTLRRSFQATAGTVSAVGINADHSRIAAGYASGTLKVWSTASVDGLDAFERSRLVGEERSPGIKAHPGAVTCVDFFPNKTHVVTGGADGSVRIWDLAKREPIMLSAGHEGPVRALAVSRGGSLFVSGGADAKVCVWNVETGELAATLKGPTHPISVVTLDEGGKSLAAGDESGTIYVWDMDAPDGVQQATAHTGPVTGLRFESANKVLISSGRDGTLCGWRLPLTEPKPIAIQSAAQALAVAEQGKYVAVLSSDSTFEVYRTDTGERRRTFTSDSKAALHALAFAAGNRLILSGSADGRVACWNSADGSLQTEIPLHTGAIRQLAAHTTQPVFATAGSDGVVGVGSILQVESLAEEKVPVRAMALSPDGQRIVAALGDGSLHVFGLDKAQRGATLDAGAKPATSVGFSLDGRFVVAGYADGQIRIWEHGAADAKAAAFQGHAAAVTGVALGLMEGRLWSSSLDGTLRIWRWPLPPERTLGRDTKAMQAVVTAKAGNLIAAGGDDGLLRLLEPGAGRVQPRSERLAAGIAALALHPDDNVVAVGTADGTVLFRDRAGTAVGSAVPGAGGRVAALAFHPQGKELAVASADGRVRFWDYPVSGSGVVDSGSGPVFAVAFSAGQRSLAVGNQNGAIRLIRLGDKTGRDLAGHRARITLLRWSADERRLLSASEDGVLRVWDPATGSAVVLDGSAVPTAAAWLPSGQEVVAAGSDRTLRVWDAATGKESRRWQATGGTATAVAASPDGTRVASADDQGRIRIWNLVDGTEVRQLQHRRGLVSLAWSPDGQRLAAADMDHAILLGDVKAGGTLQPIGGHSAAVRALVFAADGQSVVSGDAVGRVQRCSRDGKSPESFVTGEAAIGELRFADGELFASSLDGRVHRLRSLAARELTAPSAVQHLTYLSDGSLATAGADGKVRIWNGSNRALVRELDGGESVRRVAVSADGRLLAAAGADQKVRVWDLPAGTPRGVVPHYGTITSVQFSPDGRLLFVASDRALRSYDAATLRLNESFRESTAAAGIGQIALLAGGKTVIAALSDGSLGMWESALIASIQADPRGLRQLYVPAGGRRLITVGTNKIQLWDAEGRPVRELSDEDAEISEVAVAADGLHVAAISARKRSQIWRTDTGAVLPPIAADAPASRIALSPDGTHVAVAAEHNLRVLAVAGGRCVAQFVADAPIDRLACLPGGRVLALTRTNRFLLCAGGSTRQVQAHQGEVHDVAFIPGTNWVVSAGADRRLQIIDWTDGAIVRRIDCGADAVTTLAVTPDGLQAYGGGKGSRIGAWDLKTGERMAEIPDAGPVSALRVSPDGRLLAAIGADRQTRVWDLRTAPPAELSSLPGQTKAAVFLNADQLLVASGEKASLQVLPVLGKWTARAGPQGIGSVEVVPNSPYVAVAGGTPEVTLWRVFGAKEKSFSVPAGQLTHVAVHPEGTQLAGAGDTAPGAAAAGQVHVWNFADGRLLRSIDVPAAIRGLAYSPTGEFLAVAGGDKHARLYRADDGRLVQEIPCEADLAALSFLPDGSTFLAGTANGQIWAHAIAAEQMVQAHAGPVRSVAVSAGGQRLLTAGGEPSTIRLWNVQSLRQPLVRFEGGAGRVVYATLSADDRLVAAVFDDPKHTVCVWPASLDGTAPAVQPIARLTHPSPVRTALITGDGKYVVVGGQGEFVHLWDAPTGKEVARFRKQDAIVQSLAANGRDRTIVAGAVDRSVRVWALPGAAGSGASGSGAGPLAVTDSERSVTLADVPPPAPAPPSGRAARTNPLDQRIARLEFEMRQAKNTDERHKVWQELLRARRERQTNTIVQSAATPAAPGAPVIESRLVSLRQQEAALRQQEAALRQQELDLIAASERVRKLQERVDKAQSDDERTESAAELVDARKDYFARNRDFLQATSSSVLATYATGHKNEMAAFHTDYVFETRVVHPVKLLASRDWIVAARPGFARADMEGEQAQVPTRVDVWDITSLQPLCSWDNVENRSLQSLLLGPDGASVLTAPDIWVFDVPQSSVRRLGIYGPCALSPAGLFGSGPLLAVGTTGQRLAVSPVLHFFEGNDLVPRATTYGDYEAMVTAVAFAHKHPRMAFAVRQRGNHRVFLADPLRLEPTRMRVLESHAHAKPWLRGQEDDEAGAPGVTTLAFSPDDDRLVLHGQYADEDYRLSVLPMSWQEEYADSSTPAQARLNASVRYAVREGENGWKPLAGISSHVASQLAVAASSFIQDRPFFQNLGHQGIGFVRAATQPASGPSPKATSDRTRADRSDSGKVKADKSAAAPVLAVFDAGSGIAVMDLANEVPYGHIPLEKTQRGRAEYAVSDDCRWLATGDDDGHVTLWSLETNKSVPLTPDGRPAHGAPVVGLAFSVTAQSGEPDYLVSAGEENAIKLWLIHDRLQDLQGIAPASRLTKDTAQVQARRASE